MEPAALRDRFGRRYGGAAQVVRAPGRVNLIGEHTDYNDGFVLPAAIDACAWIAVAPRDDRQLVIHSENLSETAILDLDADAPQQRSHWSDYPFGVAVTLQRAGLRLRGANLLVLSEVPLGAGLSSSAALEVATALAILRAADLSLDPLEVARACQLAENEFVGARCGIMDQFTACCGQAGNALLLDCRALRARPVPLPPNVRLVICNTMVRHALAAGEYNRRRSECEIGTRLLAEVLPGVRALRDVTPADVEQHAALLPDAIARRCRHVVTENLRVLDAAAALTAGDLATVGRLMSESHRSLRDDYEVSCRELDLLVELASALDGVHAARMTGGGFGGCTVNLVAEAAVDRFRDTIAQRYLAATGRTPEIYVYSAAAGAF